MSGACLSMTSNTRAAAMQPDWKMGTLGPAWPAQGSLSAGLTCSKVGGKQQLPAQPVRGPQGVPREKPPMMVASSTVITCSQQALRQSAWLQMIALAQKCMKGRHSSAVPGAWRRRAGMAPVHEPWTCCRDTCLAAAVVAIGHTDAAVPQCLRRPPHRSSADLTSIVSPCARQTSCRSGLPPARCVLGDTALHRLQAREQAHQSPGAGEEAIDTAHTEALNNSALDAHALRQRQRLQQIARS